MALLEAPTTTLPLIFPLAEAAREMGVEKRFLHDMAQSGKICAFVEPDGTMYVQMTDPKAFTV
ncbi:MAG TPA: hypothetical protein G4O04_08285 [Anaerolineae bacterium]|nr:hypothetical protein [Anaerolineae bacterium]HID85739.1 hypothetical protein [Anaerolineales bacterium]HIQ09571.1 hypothetical protein [Anaerolineaceae bacterium]